MKFWIVSFVAAGAVMLVVDAFWLSTMGRLLYRPLLGDILLEDFRLAPAIIFYLLYVTAIVVFAISPAARADSAWTAFLFGAFLGLVAYGTYDLTNHATLKAWTTTLTAVDMAWGATLTALSASIGFLVARLTVGLPQ